MPMPNAMDLAVFLEKLAGDMVESKADDGKITLFDAPNFTDSAIAGWDAVVDADKAWAEFQASSAAEKAAFTERMFKAGVALVNAVKK